MQIVATELQTWRNCERDRETRTKEEKGTMVGGKKFPAIIAGVTCIGKR